MPKPSWPGSICGRFLFILNQCILSPTEHCSHPFLPAHIRMSNFPAFKWNSFFPQSTLYKPRLLSLLSSSTLASPEHWLEFFLVFLKLGDTESDLLFWSGLEPCWGWEKVVWGTMLWDERQAAFCGPKGTNPLPKWTSNFFSEMTNRKRETEAKVGRMNDCHREVAKPVNYSTFDDLQWQWNEWPWTAWTVQMGF